MTSSTYKTIQYTSAQVVESAGAILFTSNHQVCLVKHKNPRTNRYEWLLPKGRRHIGENRQATAIREAREETGYSCSILPVNLDSRAPPADETDVNSPDGVREYQKVCEPFMMTLRHLEDEKDVKLIWWYVAKVDEDAELGEGEEKFHARLFGFDEGSEKLTFLEDREVLDRAIGIYTSTYG